MRIKIFNFTKDTDVTTKKYCQLLDVNLAEFIRDAIGAYLWLIELRKANKQIFTFDGETCKEVRFPQHDIVEIKNFLKN